ncbi:hypothetical protein EOL70_15855 [Leucothrix sargassi]|nr:hypothetical protein EOL70_15855 [Leucothrix sargassi]
MELQHFTRQLSISGLLLTSILSYSTASAEITIDGDISDWSSQDRLELSPRVPVEGFEISGRYENNNYNILLRNLNGPISTRTTLWLNTDQNIDTGFLIFDFAGGAEYNVNIAEDGLPYLYTDADGETLVAGPLEHSFSTDGSITNMELAIPEALIGNPTTEGINILADVNNTTFLPTSFFPHENNYVLLKETIFGDAGITIDGNKSDWTQANRLDTDPAVALNTAEIYGRFEDNSYKILIEDLGTADVTAGTTLWLNTDNNLNTGHQVFGYAGGAEYNINFSDADNLPYLYTGSAGQTLVDGPLNFAVTADGINGATLEIEVPASLLGNPSGDGVSFIADLSNSSFLPRAYYPNTNNYFIPNAAETAPIAIIYSETSESQFFDSKAYAQLFMSVQAQAMMAGLPFDLLSERDLLSINKITPYKTLVFPFAANIPAELLAAIEQNLTTAVNDFNVGIVTASNFLTNNETGDNLTDDAYIRMKSLLGLTRSDGGGPFNISYQIANSTHPITSNEFANNEVLRTYNNGFTDYFVPTGDYPATVIAEQVIDNDETHNALIITENGGRHAHFGTVQQMTDTNLLWSVLQWSVYGEKAPAALNLSRENSVFVGRNDMDQSMFIDQVEDVEGRLLTFLQLWKDNYDFVGSYYINVGDNPANQEVTDWSISRPLYQQYIALGNEIGTHSYTHPVDTNVLSAAQLEREFAGSREIIEDNMSINNLSAAVPGAPEDLRTSLEVIQHVDYLTGGFSGSGAGYPNAMGFLHPTQTKVYLSPNMSFDFTLVQFQRRSAEESQQIWFDEFDQLVSHTNLGLVHWPWHDYGPTNSDNAGYTFEMFDNLLARASNYGSEFITGKDFADRIKTFRAAGLSVTRNGNVVTANVDSNDTGKFALNVADGTTISSVNNWYAYNDNQVLLANAGREYTINLGAPNTNVSRITSLPRRGELVSVTGDGTDLAFEFTGKGTVNVQLRCAPTEFTVSGGTNQFIFTTPTQLGINFLEDREHATTRVDATCP